LRYTLLNQQHSRIAVVSFKEYGVLHLPLEVTNLTPTRSILRTKLTRSAIVAFISLAEQCEVLCPSKRTNCGEDSLLPSNPESKRN
jgi:hypothetical protein